MSGILLRKVKILWSLKDICMLNDLHLEGTF